MAHTDLTDLTDLTIRELAAEIKRLGARLDALEGARYIVPFRRSDGRYVEILVQRLNHGAQSPFEPLEIEPE